jgi:hypothetical protein
MAKTNKLIYDIRESLKQYQDDTELSDRYIMYLWGLYRSKYLRQDLNNFQKTIDNSIVQSFCIELEEVSANECDDLDNDCGTIMRTKTKVPKPLELHLKSGITSVKPTSKISPSFSFLTKERALFSKYSPIKNTIFSFLDNDGYIYLISESPSVKLIECITVTGIFEDPLELENFNSCCKCENIKCFNFDESEYPLPAHHIGNIRTEIIKSLVGTLNIPEDNDNNANDK